MLKGSVKLFLALFVLVTLGSLPSLAHYDHALGIVTVFDGKTQVVAERVEVTKEGGQPQVLEPQNNAYFAFLDTGSRYTLDVRLADGRQMSVSGLINRRQRAVAMQVTFTEFAHRVNTTRVGRLPVCVGKIQLVDKNTNQNIQIQRPVLIHYMRTDSGAHELEKSLTTKTDENGFAAVILSKPGTWEVRVAPFEKTVKSEVLKFKLGQHDIERSLRLPVTVVEEQRSIESTGGM